MDPLTKALVNTVNSIVSTPVCESCEKQKVALNEHACFTINDPEQREACLRGVRSRCAYPNICDTEGRVIRQVRKDDEDAVTRLFRKKTTPTPGKTPFDDRAGDTSIDAANDPARGGQSGAWGGGAGTPAPERKPPTFQDFIDSMIRPGKPPKPSPYDKYHGPGKKMNSLDGLRI